MIYKRGKRWRVIVYAGRDPVTGRKRQKSVSVDTRAEAKQAVLVGNQAARAPQSVRGARRGEVLPPRFLREQANEPRAADRLPKPRAAFTNDQLRPRTIQTALGELEAAGLAAGSEEGNGRARYWSPATPDDGAGGGAGTP